MFTKFRPRTDCSLTAAIAGLGLLTLIGCGGNKPGGPGGSPGALPVNVYRPLVTEIVEWDRYTGRLAAIESVELRARVSGYVQAVPYTADQTGSDSETGEGRMVNRGDLLFQLDPEPFELELKIAEAKVLEAEKNKDAADELRKQASASLAEVQETQNLRTIQFERMRQLRDQNAVSQEEFDSVKSEFEKASKAVETATVQVAVAEAGIASAVAAVATAEANRAAAALNLEYTDVRAPIRGQVGAELVTPGNLINGGSSGTVLTTIVSTNPIHCYFDANEQEFLKYARLDREGARESSRTAKNPAYLKLVDEQGYPRQGHMDFVDNQIDPNTGTMRGRAIFRNDDGALVPGLFAEIRIPGSGSYDAVLIDDSVIGSDQSEKFVYVISEEGKAVRTTLELGPIVKGLRVVRAGLTGSEPIAAGNLQKLVDGAPVEVIWDEDQPTFPPLAVDELPSKFEKIPRERWISRNTDHGPIPSPSATDGAKGAGE